MNLPFQSQIVTPLVQAVATTPGTLWSAAVPGVTQLQDGLKVSFFSPEAAQGLALTLSVQGLVAKPIVRWDLSALKSSDVGKSMMLVEAIYSQSLDKFVLTQSNTSLVPIVVRHSIQYGPTTGTPAVSDLIPQSQINATLATGVTVKFSTKPTLLSLADGFNSDGSPNNINIVLNTDMTITGLTASQTNVIAYDRTNNVLVKTIVLDTDTKGGTPAVTNGLYTLDYENWKMYLGNGTVATPVQHIILAEVDTDATKVTAIRCRAYKRSFEGAFTNTLTASGVTMIQNSNLGTASLVESHLEIECISTEYGFAVGDRICGTFAGSNGNYGVALTIAHAKNTIRASMVVGGAPWIGVAPSNGSFIILTAAKWKWRFVAKAGY